MKKNLWVFLLMLLLLTGLSFCNREELIPGDQVIGRDFFLTTDDVNSITCSGARSGGCIIDNVSESGPMTAQGVCWSTTQNPTTSDNKTIDKIYTDQPHFFSTMTGLNSGTTYYVRAYATNSAGITYYGNELDFSIPGERLPIVITDTVIIISTLSSPNVVQVRYNITDDGCVPITVNGVCWSTSQDPTINDNKVEKSGPSFRFSISHLDGLEFGTTYYVRAYATNRVGTAYGNEISFTTLDPFTQIIGSVTDVEGNTYKTIKIGTQTWMAENLKTTRYNDGSPILFGTGGPAGYTKWFNIEEGAYCWYDNDAKTFKDAYGAIYNWHAVGTGKLCPTGWHVPTYSEWTTLVTFLGGEEEAFNEKTENAEIHWESSNNNINESGFNPAPSGELCGWGFLPCDLWWSATPRTTELTVLRSAYLITFRIIGFEPASYGYPVRCLKD